MNVDTSSESPPNDPISPNEVIRVVLADNQPVARLGTRHVLETDHKIEVVGEVSGRTEAVLQAHAHRPHLLITEMKLTGGLGTELPAALEDKGLQIPVLILSAYGDRRHLTTFLESKAVGYLLKHENPAVLVEAIYGIYQGNHGWFSRQVANHLLALQRSELRDPCLSSLTERETTLLTVLAQGFSNRKIAAELGLSVGTVKNYLTSIYKKLGIGGRGEAITWVHKHGLVG